MHELHSEQERLLKDFLSCFIRPESIPSTVKKLKKLAPEDTTMHLPHHLLFFGYNTKKLLFSRDKNDLIQVTFIAQALEAYVKCAKVLLTKMPLDSPILQAFSILDPKLRGTSVSLHYMQKLPEMLPLNLTDKEMEEYDKEIRGFQLDPTLPSLTNTVRIDHWWSLINSKKYPLLTRAAKTILSCFHGPVVESTFSIMGQILHKHNTQMDIETYSSYQSIKYTLLASEKSAVSYFSKKDPEREAVNKTLTFNMRQARSLNEERKRAQLEKRRLHMLEKGMAPSQSSKRQANEDIMSVAKKSRPDTCNSDSTSELTPGTSVMTKKTVTKETIGVGSATTDRSTFTTGKPSAPKRSKQSSITGFFNPRASSC